MKAPSVFMASFDGHRMELAAGCATMDDIFHLPYEIFVYEGVRTPRVDEFRPSSEMPNPMPFRRLVPQQLARLASRRCKLLVIDEQFVNV